MIKTIEGNLLNATEDIIGHQVNCRGVMGSGVALQIKQKWPTSFGGYIELCGIKGREKLLGLSQFIETPDGKVIANLFGQDDYGRGRMGYWENNKLVLQS